jgi:hypothetical protein
MLLELIGEILCSRQGQTRRDDALNSVRQLSTGLSRSKSAHVGSDAKLTKRVLLLILPLSSKSCLKNLAVSMLTPIAAKTMEKLSS